MHQIEKDHRDRGHMPCLSSVLCCQLRFPHKTMFGSSLLHVVCRRARVLFTWFVFVCVYWCLTPIVLCSCFTSSCVPYVSHSLDCFCFVFLRLVYPMFPILWIVHYWLPKVFFKIYFLSSDLHQCLQPLKLWVRLLSMVMCTRCNKFIKNVYLSSMVCGLFPITKLISMR